jgi:hypothetical protein
LTAPFPSSRSSRAISSSMRWRSCRNPAGTISYRFGVLLAIRVVLFEFFSTSISASPPRYRRTSRRAYARRMYSYAACL